MKNCILCGTPTEGSIGAAGLRWRSICQACKDKEDDFLAVRIKAQVSAFKMLSEAIRNIKKEEVGV